MLKQAVLAAPAKVRSLFRRVLKAPLGIESWNSDDDQARLAAGSRTIFDVGANVGQSVVTYQNLFPLADIWSFEPVPWPMMQLQRKYESDSHVHLHQIALSDTSGSFPIYVHPKVHDAGMIMSSLLKPIGREVGETIEIPACTLDEFCEANGVESIDILKVDVQGAEMKVFRGAREMFRRGAIRFVFTEVFFSPMYEGMPLMWDQHAELLSHGFRLYRLYSLPPDANGVLHQANALYTRST